ncbi:hypothetical protein E1A91_A13G190100v1 [Gossypium mustelinum]|uniref:Uncharacterized protein n=3 Tax=Gossypium TaxID=3633 RepID=A0A5J5T112_GOSBA|nr:hypothetical protein ES319_A13G183500v1 [Gossypium barbadense]TYG87208.1 hypothetical protein ES288_A13G194900v1 [Gossypium darwinii]TYJ01946.1 hypothetical protein E1A91_A13G190100v1 [Gossypium mustelinum]
MDLQDVIMFTAMVVEAARMREETRRMSELLRSLYFALREKDKEYEMLKKKKQSMVAKEAPKLKMVDDFMLFLDAIDKNDGENALNFDEKAMMNSVLAMMNGGNNGDGGKNEA